MSGSLRLEGKILKIAMKMLSDTADIFKKNNVKYVLEAGTLLGIIRENRLLPWDNDIDITVTEDVEKKVLALKWKFILKGYRFRIKKYKNDVGPFKKDTVRIIKVSTRRFIFFKKYELLDIFIKRKIETDRENYYWTVGVKNPVLKSTPIKFYDEISTITFQNKEYLLPKEYTNYLEYHYGKNWKTPIKKWNFRLDDNCTKKELKDKV